MEKNLEFIFNYMKFAKIEKVIVEYDFSSKWHEDTRFRLKIIDHGWTSGSSKRVNNIFKNKIFQIINSNFEKIYESVGLDIDDYWYLVVEISLFEKTFEVTTFEKVIEEEPKKEITLKIDDFEKKTPKKLKEYFGDKFTIHFYGSWDEVSDVEIETDQGWEKIPRTRVSDVYDCIQEIMCKLAGNYWNESQGAYGEILIWDEDVFVEYVSKYEEYQQTNFKMLLKYEPKAINENENKSYEPNKDQEIAFQKLLILIKRKYPFIKDMIFKEIGKFWGKEVLFVTLVVDLEKVKEFYNTDFSETYYNFPYLFDTLKHKESMSFLFTPFDMKDKDKLVGFNDEFDFYINKLVKALPTRLRTPNIKIDKFIFNLDSSKYYNAKEYFFQNHGFYPTSDFFDS